MTPASKYILSTAAIIIAGAIILGAFAAHGLKASLDSHHLSIFKTGVQYHFYHGIGIFLVGLLSLHTAKRYLITSGIMMLVGIILFSGSLYWLSFEGPRWLGPITPIGGLLFILAWLTIAIGVLRD